MCAFLVLGEFLYQYILFSIQEPRLELHILYLRRRIIKVDYVGKRLLGVINGKV